MAWGARPSPGANIHGGQLLETKVSICIGTWAAISSRDFAIGSMGGRLRDLQTGQFQTLDMEFHGVMHFLLHLFPGEPCSGTSRNVRRVGGESGAGRFDDDEVTVHFS